MEKPKHAGGRPSKTEEEKKKSRGISLTDAEYTNLLALSAAAGYPGQPSAYLIKKLRLNATTKPKPSTDE